MLNNKQILLATFAAMVAAQEGSDGVCYSADPADCWYDLEHQTCVDMSGYGQLDQVPELFVYHPYVIGEHLNCWMRPGDDSVWFEIKINETPQDEEAAELIRVLVIEEQGQWIYQCENTQNAESIDFNCD